jgi:hypothetical protein
LTGREIAREEWTTVSDGLQNAEAGHRPDAGLLPALRGRAGSAAAQGDLFTEERNPDQA